MTSSSTSFSRRAMLRSMLLGGSMATFGGFSTLGNLTEAHAMPLDIPDRYYIFCYFSGAWDILMSLDPRDPVKFNDGNRSITRIQPGYALLGKTTDPRIVPKGLQGSGMETMMGDPAHFYGETMGELLTDPEIVSRLLVIRGMSMDTLTHEVGRRRFLTGKQPAGLAARGSSTDTWMASQLSKNEPIPNLSLRMESYNRGLPTGSSALKANNVDDLLRVLSPGDVQLESLQERQLDQLLRQQALCNQTRISSKLQEAEISRQKAKLMLTQNLDRLFDFRAKDEAIARVKGDFGLPDNPSPADPLTQAAVAGVAITRGVSRCVSVQVIGGLDTHFDNWTTDQGPRQRQGFNAVARLAKYLNKTPYVKNGKQDGSWLDHTTIVGFSEFSRTPLLNGNTGRDHWLGNSCFMLGGGVKGGRVIGKSSDFGMYPTKVDLKTGMIDELAGEVVRPEHIIRALYDEIGMDDSPDLRVKGLSAIFG